MKSLQSFLKLKRKENLKFVLSDAFVDDDGQPIEGEKRQISARQGMELGETLGKTGYIQTMLGYVERALVYPNLHDKELLDGLSERESRRILKAEDALIALLSDAELSSLITTYTSYNRLTEGVDEMVEEAKKV